ncbi:MAG: S46 family peptidase [Bdellovibrionota bacterium]
MTDFTVSLAHRFCHRRLVFLTMFMVALFLGTQLGFAQNQMVLPIEGHYDMESMHEAGLNITEEDLHNLAFGTSPRYNEACSATFVSPDGLFTTNHHCADVICVPALDLASSANAEKLSMDHILTNGYIAETRSQEILCKGNYIHVLTEVVPVSNQFLDDYFVYKSEITSANKIEKITRRIEQACNQEKEKQHCRVLHMDNGRERFYLFKYDVIDDIRLSWLPPQSIGNFGGQTHNWRYPRYTGDFTFLRAYKNGKPYTPKHFARVTPKGVKPDEPIFVLGYPGKTQRNATSHELVFVQKINRRTMDQFGRLISTLRPFIDTKNFSSYQPSMDTMNNEVMSSVHTQNAIHKNNLIKALSRKEADYTDSDLVDLLKEFKILFEKRSSVEAKNFLIAFLTIPDVFPSIALNALFQTYISLEEAGDDGFRIDKNAKDKLIEAYNKLHRNSSLSIEMGVWSTYLEMLHNAGHDFPSFQNLQEIAVSKSLACKTLEKETEDEKLKIFCSIKGDDVFTNSAAYLLTHSVFRPETPDSHQVLSNPYLLKTDPLIRFYLGVMNLQGSYYLQYVEFTQTLKNMHRTFNTLTQSNEPPNANGSLRLSVSTVLPRYLSPETGNACAHVTSLSDMVNQDQCGHANNPDQAYFGVPEPIKRLSAKRNILKKSPFYDPIIQDIPINFLSNAMTSGGSSGSGVLNQDGEMVGILFDSDTQGLLADYSTSFNDFVVILDLRYIGFLATEVYPNARWITNEMGLTQ